MYRLLILVLLTGCATVSETYGLDGRPAFTLNCSGTARTWNMCRKAAGELCGARGYDVIERLDSDDNRPAFELEKDIGHSRSMVVSCRG